MYLISGRYLPQDTLKKELDFYNSHREHRPEISWKDSTLLSAWLSPLCNELSELVFRPRVEDALWGLTAAFTRSFDCDLPAHRSNCYLCQVAWQPYPEVPSTQHLRLMVPKTKAFSGFGNQKPDILTTWTLLAVQLSAKRRAAKVETVARAGGSF